MADVNDEFDRLLTTLDVDDAADEVDQAGQYVEWFTANALKIIEFDYCGLCFGNAVILRDLWARFGRAQHTLMQYAGNGVHWKWYNLSGNMNFPKENTADGHSIFDWR